jgi:hypothetical protein
VALAGLCLIYMAGMNFRGTVVSAGCPLAQLVNSMPQLIVDLPEQKFCWGRSRLQASIVGKAKAKDKAVARINAMRAR